MWSSPPPTPDLSQSWSDRQNVIGVTHNEWGTFSSMSGYLGVAGISTSTWSYNPDMPLGRECPLPSIPRLNHDTPSYHNSCALIVNSSELMFKYFILY